MTVSALSPTPTSASATEATSNALRSADFMKIMLSELKQQDPMEPQDTSKLVDNMQKMQELANTQFTKFRNDVRWAQDLMGKSVTVQQQGITDKEATAQINAGLNPDVGYGNATGPISSFRVVGQEVYVHVGNYDYPTDNVKQVVPMTQDPAQLSSVANNVLGRQVGYWLGTTDKAALGIVTGVGWDTNGETTLTVDGKTKVPYANVTSISIPANANSN